MTSPTDKQFLKQLGARIAIVRREKGITQEELADTIDVHRTYIGFIEQGTRNPTINNLRKIANALQISLRELFKPF